jgi:hypothetical protein
MLKLDLCPPAGSILPVSFCYRALEFLKIRNCQATAVLAIRPICVRLLVPLTLIDSSLRMRFPFFMEACPLVIRRVFQVLMLVSILSVVTSAAKAATSAAQNELGAARALIDKLTSLPPSKDQVVRPREVSNETEQEYVAFIRSYFEMYRLLGRAKACGVKVNQRVAELNNVLNYRHKDDRRGLELANLVADLGIEAGEKNLTEGFDPAGSPPRTPLPCGLFDQRIERMQLPPIPPALRAVTPR